MDRSDYNNVIQCPHCDHKYSRDDSLSLTEKIKNGCLKKFTCNICHGEFKVLKTVAVVFQVGRCR
jgi:uncharacterized protein YlaI